jgi:hypothetical protein
MGWRKVGWRKGSIGKDNDGIATALTGQSIGGHTNRAGLGSKQGGANNSSTRLGEARGSGSNRNASKDNTNARPSGWPHGH